MSTLIASHLGPTAYADGLRIQDRLVARRAAGEVEDCLLFPDHPPVLTVGRNPSEGNVRADAATLAALGIEVFEVPRGGDVTWHGPGQLVGYAVCDLTRRGRDLHRFLRDMEEVLIRTAARFGVEARRWPGRTGIWVQERKLGSVGVAVRRWTTFHGFALNVAPDLRYFQLIHPCGLQDIQMTSLERLLGPRAPTLADARAAAATELARVLGHDEVRWVHPSIIEIGEATAAVVHG